MTQEITKDHYDFGFITVPVNYKEITSVTDPTISTTWLKW